VLDAQEDIKSQVQEELGERQREMLLREQMKAIRKELGEEGDAAEADDLKKRLDALELPEAARKEVDRELGRLERAGRESMEAQVIRTYLETLAELPWNKRAEESLDLKRAAEILEEDHYGLQDVKDQVLEFLAVRQLRQQQPKEEAPGNEDDRAARAPTLLFVGPPGVGKTSIAKSIARAMGRPYVRISLGGARDEADIRGHRRTYVGAMPGRIIQGMKQAGAKNPIFLLDEVDKLGVSFQGDPAAALLEVLDPAQNDTFTDHYLGVPFDLSEVLFIATANFIQGIPGPLLDRLETVNFAGYTEREKLEIAKRYLVPRQVRENGLRADQFELREDALEEIIASYTREAGVRQLEREIGKLGRKVARKIADGAAQKVTVSEKDIPDLIGRPKVHPERMAGEDQVGVSTGMYYTPVGGDIMFVEASVMHGKGELVLTGQLGDVMKESARAALTYAKSHADLLGIPANAFVDTDIHVHVPAGAIPKDGPSAGVTMATALVSALSRRPARHDIAMTGEVTLRGRVLPIGGVKEKVLGAVRAGITSVILPKENEPDLEDLPDEVRKTLDVHLVEELGDVLSLALRGARFESGHLIFETEAPLLARSHAGHN
jgi:ATP-dependent Lon protease